MLQNVEMGPNDGAIEEARTAITQYMDNRLFQIENKVTKQVK